MPPDPAQAEMLFRFLQGRDVACPDCDYNLRDLPGDRCPECGQELALRLQLAEPKQAALLTGLVGLSAGAGLNALLLIYFVLIVFFQGIRPSGMTGFLLSNAGGLVVQGAAIALWLRMWRRIRVLPAGQRWSLAAGCCFLSLANVVVFSIVIR